MRCRQTGSPPPEACAHLGRSARAGSRSARAREGTECGAAGRTQVQDGLADGDRRPARARPGDAKDVAPRELEEVLRLEYRSKLLNPKWAQVPRAPWQAG